jgi:hypothetical protein
MNRSVAIDSMVKFGTFAPFVNVTMSSRVDLQDGHSSVVCRFTCIAESRPFACYDDNSSMELLALFVSAMQTIGLPLSLGAPMPDISLSVLAAIPLQNCDEGFSDAVSSS